jgi:hypothetical protein
LDFIAQSTASVDYSADLCKCNPFLDPADANGVLTCMCLLMMTYCRISQSILALQQCRSIIRVIEQLRLATTSSAERPRLLQELVLTSELLAANLSMKRFYCSDIGGGLYEFDPRFLLFEFAHGLLLRASQVELVRDLLGAMGESRSVCKQMIMGAGKTTVVGPLLALLLASSQSLVVEVVPPALLDFSAGVLRERFGSCVKKTIFTFTFDRYQQVEPQLLSKLEIARFTRAIIVTTPSAVKSFMLKFLELCHNLGRQHSLALEKKEKKSTESFFSLSKVRSLLGLGGGPGMSAGEMTGEEIAQARRQLSICDKIFQIFRDSVEIMDEVDIILHPLKSELNWPLGAKEPLDFTRSRTGNGLRWSLPSHLLDAIFSVCDMPIIADIADSRVAGMIIVYD